MRLILPLLLSLACAAASAGEVYKWRDKDGRLHYGDRPKDAQAESVTVTPSSGSGETSPVLANEQERMAECQRKRAQLESWRAAPTMSEVDNLGKTREYTPAERQQFLAMTEAKVAELCAPPKGPVQPVDVFPPPEAEEPAIELPPEEPAG
ncbi:MAG: DUF4124 domain-containing protein [Nevskiaceae bacterium]